MTAPLAFRRRLVRQNTALFHWSADDGDVLTCRSGQAGTYSRASGDTVLTATGSTAVGISQPRWLDTPYGASAYMLPASSVPDVWHFTLDFLLQPVAIYVAGYLKQGGSGSGSTRILRLGDGAANSIDLTTALPGNGTTATYIDGGSSPAETLNSGNPVSGDYVEYRVTLDSARKITLTRTINLGTPVVSSISAAGAAFSGGFHGAVLNIADGSNASAFAYRHILIVAS